MFFMIFAKQNDMKRNETKWNDCSHFPIWMKSNFQGCSFIVNGAKLSLDNGRIGERWIFFCWPKKRTWGKIRAVEHGTFFLAEVRLFKKSEKMCLPWTFDFAMWVLKEGDAFNVWQIASLKAILVIADSLSEGPTFQWKTAQFFWILAPLNRTPIQNH